MEKILLNLALINLTNFCHQNNIPANGRKGEGTTCKKIGRGFTYGIVSDTTQKPVALVTFKKHSLPEFVIPS